MTALINASTSSGVVVTSDTSGSLAFQSNGTTIATVTPTGITTQVGAPAFSAYLNTTQSISSSTWTKVTLDTERFDTNNNFASARFTPTVAGYYQINAVLYLSQSGNASSYAISIYKNGSDYQSYYLQASASNEGLVLSTLVSMNGTTDYLELYGQVSGTSPVFVGGSTQNCSFSGFLARSA